LIFLETENEKLKTQLKEAQDEIRSLREENIDLRKIASETSPTKRKAQLNQRIND